jgi:hypothetical protein
MMVPSQPDNVGEACIHNLPAIFDVLTRRAPAREELRVALDSYFAMLPRLMELMLNVCSWQVFKMDHYSVLFSTRVEKPRANIQKRKHSQIPFHACRQTREYTRIHSMSFLFLHQADLCAPF